MMDIKQILTDDRIHYEAVHHIDSIAFFEAACWARDFIASVLDGEGGGIQSQKGVAK